LARWTPAPRFWLSSSFSYGSGLPIEGEGDLVLSNVDPRVRRAIDPLRSRVKPSFSLDAQAGARLWQLEKQILTAQLEGFNLTDHFNLINFSGAFSGTALAPPRSFAIKLAFAF
jgi:hypothetical protein